MSSTDYGQTGAATDARRIALDLAAWPSVTGSAGEAAFAPLLAAYLRARPTLHHAGLVVEVWPVPGDALGRASVVAHLPGAGDAAVLLTGHFDVVPVDDYGTLAPLAWDPGRLAPALIDRLRDTGEDPQALADLESGAFLPGRGLLDMKAGLAAGIAAMERHAAAPERRGHLVLIATPDEEDRSAGMRAVADVLASWLAECGLQARLGINLDALCDDGDGSAARVVALGCIGKLLLSALVVGRDAHACYPLAGINGAYLAAELVAEMEYAPELGECTGGELASPPTVLGMRDLKPGYNVTTPSRVWATWNVLTHRRPTAEVLRRVAVVAERAVSRARDRLTQRARAVVAAAEIAPEWDRVDVLTFAEAWVRALARTPDFAEAFKRRAADLAAEASLDFPTRCQILTEYTWGACGHAGPAIVLGFASMPYPAISWPDGKRADALERAIAAAAASVAARHTTSVAIVRYLQVIADMSFLGPVGAEDLTTAAAQTPIWGSSIVWDTEHNPGPAIPIVNIGPWGRDYHHVLERVNVAYAFGVLPDLVHEVAMAALGQETV